MDTNKTVQTDRMFQAYCRYAGISSATYDVVAFGDSPAMADELGNLVLRGPKRATASLRRDFTEEALPRAGGYAVVIDGRGNPLCIFQTSEVRVGPLQSVDDAFAWDEGEGDRTRQWWLNAHIEFFEREAKALGRAFDEGEEVVFERFRVVWPLSAMREGD